MSDHPPPYREARAELTASLRDSHPLLRRLRESTPGIGAALLIPALRRAKSPSGIRALYVEDDQPLASVVLKVGQVGSKISIDHRPDLRSGIESLTHRHPYDVILLDVGLPDAGWPDALDRIHAQASGTPIIVMSGLEISLAEVRAHGAADLIRKGTAFTFDRIFAGIATAILSRGTT